MNIVIFPIYNLLCCPSRPINYCKWKEPGETPKWGRGCEGALFTLWNSQSWYFSIEMPVFLRDGWGHGGWLSWEQTWSQFFLLGHFVYGVKCVVWGKHVAPVFCVCLVHGCPTKDPTWLLLLLACIPLWLKEGHKQPTGVVSAGRSARSSVINTCSDLD